MMSHESTNYQYPWIASVPENPEDYLEPGYYDKLLKDYSFGGRTDLELLGSHLESAPTVTRMLELGCGSGRATQEIMTQLGRIESLDLVDLSEEMVGHCRSKYADQDEVSVIKSDSVDFLGNSTQTYSSVVSMWNLSHSVHQHMISKGREAGSTHVASALDKFIVHNLEVGGSMYLFHYDIQSAEQRLINPWRLNLWEEADPNYDASDQSPSKDLLDDLLTGLQDRGFVSFEVDHLVGDPIEYPSKNIALETFLNFHMEGYYNTRAELPDVIDSLLRGFDEYTDKEGVVRIPPGAFVYKIGRTDKPQLSRGSLHRSLA